MTDIVTIHGGKQPVRRHFLAEHLEARDLKPADLVRLLNDEERSMDLPSIDKSQVYKWIKGQMPGAQNQERIASALHITPEQLLRPPESDWFQKFFAGRDEDEVERMKTMLEAAFPKKSPGRR